MHDDGTLVERGTVESYLSGLSSTTLDPSLSDPATPAMIPGGVGLTATIDEPLHDALAAAMSFDISPVVNRYGREYGLTEQEVREHEIEIKRFLVLCAHSDTPYAIMPPLDYLWHTFILFTQMYSDFCDAIAGKYLHHTPTEVGGRSPDEQLKSYDSLLQRYLEVFGSEPPLHIWPRLTAMTGGSECDFHPPCS